MPNPKHAAWRLARPVLHPTLWRLRSFFTASTERELVALRDAQDALRDAQNAFLARLDRPTIDLPPPPRPPLPAPSPGLAMGDTPAERWLVTLLLLGPAHP